MEIKVKRVFQPLENKKILSFKKYNDFRKTVEEDDWLHIWKKYVEVFKKDPPQEIAGQLVWLKIAYELIMQDYHDSEITEIPEKVRQNYKAAQALNIEDFTKEMKIMVKIKLEQNNKGKEKMVMKNGEKKVVKTNGKETVTQSYLRLFELNFTKKWTDDQLCAEMQKLHPDKKKYTPKDIGLIRGLFNRGGLAGQKSTPKVKLEAIK